MKSPFIFSVCPFQKMPNSVNPYSLILQRSVCAYCNKVLTEQHSTLVWWNFGILHCAEHAHNANVDTCAFLHKHKFVRIRDALSNPILAPLFEILQNGVSVVRTSGLVQPGWKAWINLYDPKCRIEGIGDEWFCIFITEENGRVIQKSVPLNSLFKDEVLHTKILLAALKALDEGIYKATASLQVEEPIEASTEIANVYTMMVNGQSCRVYMPQIAQV